MEFNVEQFVESIKFEWQNPSHSYLFVGEDVDVLNHVAINFAEKITGGRTPDIFKIDLPVIKVANITEIIDESIKKTFVSKYKIFIIFNADNILEIAQNKLLKTLEEPNANVIFILTSSKPNKLLPTVISRVKRIDVVMGKNFSEEDISYAKGLIMKLNSSADLPQVVSECRLVGTDFFEVLQELFKRASVKEEILDGYSQHAICNIIHDIDEFYIMYKANVNFNYCMDLLFYKILEERFLCK